MPTPGCIDAVPDGGRGAGSGFVSRCPGVAAGSPAPSPVGSPVPSLVPAQRLDDLGAARLHVVPSADWLAVTDGYMWGAVGAGVQQFAADDGQQLASLPVPGETCLAMDVGFDALWVGACQTGAPSLVRIDPVTATVVARIPIDSPTSSRRARSLPAKTRCGSRPPRRSDAGQGGPGDDTVVATFPMPDSRWRPGWLRRRLGGTAGQRPVLHIDPSDGRHRRPGRCRQVPRFMAIGEDAVWA